MTALTPGTLLGDVRDRSIVVSRRAAKDLLVLPDETLTELGVDGVSSAVRELTRLLRQARVTHAAVDGYPAKVRLRSYPLGIDLTARVADDGELLTVLTLSARPHVRRKPRPNRGEGGRA